MHIDSRELGLHELLLKLREILSSKCGCSVNIEILIRTAADANKIKTFALMSGCNATIDKRDDHFVIRVDGTPCCT